MVKRDVYKWYNLVVIFTSLILIFHFLILSKLLQYFPTKYLFINYVLAFIGYLGFIFFGLAVYSLIMLVYILAKRKKEEYLFGFIVPLLLFGFSLLAEGSRIPPFNRITTPNQYLIIILFFYSLYHFWRKSS